MSWDIFIQDLPQEIQRIKDIPDDFEPKIIGTRDSVIKSLCELFPNIDFSDKTWGILDGSKFQIEFNMGNEEHLNGFTLHIHGDSEEAIDIVLKVCSQLGLKAIDPNCENLFNKKDALKSFNEWKEYRERALE